VATCQLSVTAEDNKPLYQPEWLYVACQPQQWRTISLYVSLSGWLYVVVSHSREGQ